MAEVEALRAARLGAKVDALVKVVIAHYLLGHGLENGVRGQDGG